MKHKISTVSIVTVCLLANLAFSFAATISSSEDVETTTGFAATVEEQDLHSNDSEQTDSAVTTEVPPETTHADSKSEEQEEHVTETSAADTVTDATTDASTNCQDIEDLAPTVAPVEHKPDHSTLINTVAVNLNLQSYPLVEDFLNLNFSTLTGLIPLVVNAAYTNEATNLSNIFWLADHVKSAKHRALILETLWKDIKESNVDHTQILSMACHLQMYTCECNVDDIETLGRYEDIISQLPEVVKQMFWGTVCIRNMHYKEFLYTDEEQFDSDRRVAFTWKPKNKYMHVIDQKHWHFEENNRCKNLLLQNEQKEYLYAASDGFTASKQKRRAFTWVPGAIVKQGEWELELVSSTGPMVFKIRNIHHNEYLYADKSYEVFDSKRRSVFVGVMGKSGDVGKWEVEVC